MDLKAAPKAPRGFETTPNYNPGQMDLYAQQYQYTNPNSMTGKLASGDQSAFAEIEAPAMRQFSELQGQNASRFSGAGMGARRGSGFKNDMSQATSNFAQDLQSKRQGLQRQAIMDMMGFSNQILGQQPHGLQEKKKSWWEQLLGAAAPAVGGLVGSALGPLGTAAGGYLGNLASGWFNSGNSNNSAGSNLASHGTNLGGYR